MLKEKLRSSLPVAHIQRKITLSSLIYLCATISLVQAQQRVVPGVNPHHYQQVPGQQQQFQHPPQPPQYQQQQQQQYQQQPQQQNLPPGHAPQQYQQPQFQQQVPVQQQPPQQQQYQQHVPPAQAQQHHGHHGQPQQVLNAANIQQERAHIQEHMQVPIDTSKMSEAELQFHYFKMHDSDNNNKLDGCELIKSLIHWHVEQGGKEQQHNEHNEQPHAEEKVFSDDELMALIDPILQMDDTSHDGYIDYPEFIRAQQKAADHQQQQQQQQKPSN